MVSPSEATAHRADDKKTTRTGHCYCGASRVEVAGPPRTIAYCHCAECRRQSGAPVAAFAAFARDHVTATPSDRPFASRKPDARRYFCPECGSPLWAEYDYVPGQLFVSVGLFDDACDLAPMLHAHADERLPWLRLSDDLPRIDGSSRALLTRTSTRTKGGAAQ